jgi:hypothetical protein
MDAQNPANPPPAAAPVCPPYSDPVEIRPEPFLSMRFVIFAVLVIALAIAAALLKTGKGSLNDFFSAPKPVPQSTPAAPQPKAKPAMTVVQAKSPAIPAAIHSVAVASPKPAEPPKPGTFVVTSISLSQPSFAIINGKARFVGDNVEVPGATGWKVSQIADGFVYLQNGTTFTTLPLNTPSIKPLDDQLKPLN